MLIFLATSFDDSARWLYDNVRSAVPESRFISAEEMAASTRWEHRVHTHGSGVAFTLPSGERICSTRASGVLNRLTYPPANPAVRAIAPDATYAMQERVAFTLGWLAAFEAPVWNRPDPEGLCGRWRHASEWVAMAAAAGLPVRPYRQGDLRDSMDFAALGRVTPASTRVESMVVVNGVATGAAVPAKIQKACQRMALLSATTILGIDLFPTTLEFAGATPYPDFRHGGQEFVNAFLEMAAQRQEMNR